MNDSLSAMRLETERLIIRPYKESDLMDSYELMQDGELLTYMHMDVLSFEQYEELFRWLLDSYGDGFEEPFKYSFPILAKESGEMVGWCGIGELDFSRPDKELYYLIRRSDWGWGMRAKRLPRWPPTDSMPSGWTGCMPRPTPATRRRSVCWRSSASPSAMCLEGWPATMRTATERGCMCFRERASKAAGKDEAWGPFLWAKGLFCFFHSGVVTKMAL